VFDVGTENVSTAGTIDLGGARGRKRAGGESEFEFGAQSSDVRRIPLPFRRADLLWNPVRGNTAFRRFGDCGRRAELQWFLLGIDRSRFFGGIWIRC
jgi:hypothetical protein